MATRSSLGSVVRAGAIFSGIAAAQRGVGASAYSAATGNAAGVIRGGFSAAAGIGGAAGTLLGGPVLGAAVGGVVSIFGKMVSAIGDITENLKLLNPAIALKQVFLDFKEFSIRMKLAKALQPISEGWINIQSKLLDVLETSIPKLQPLFEGLGKVLDVVANNLGFLNKAVDLVIGAFKVQAAVALTVASFSIPGAAKGAFAGAKAGAGIANAMGGGANAQIGGAIAGMVFVAYQGGKGFSYAEAYKEIEQLFAMPGPKKDETDKAALAKSFFSAFTNFPGNAPGRGAPALAGVTGNREAIFGSTTGNIVATGPLNIGQQKAIIPGQVPVDIRNEYLNKFTMELRMMDERMVNEAADAFVEKIHGAFAACRDETQMTLADFTMRGDLAMGM